MKRTEYRGSPKIFLVREIKLGVIEDTIELHRHHPLRGFELFSGFIVSHPEAEIPEALGIGAKGVGIVRVKGRDTLIHILRRAGLADRHAAGLGGGAAIDLVRNAFRLHNIGGRNSTEIRNSVSTGGEKTKEDLLGEVRLSEPTGAG